MRTVRQRMEGRNKELVLGLAGSRDTGRLAVRTGDAINDINATTSKHDSISSRAGGIINNKFR